MPRTTPLGIAPRFGLPGARPRPVRGETPPGLRRPRPGTIPPGAPKAPRPPSCDLLCPSSSSS
ncbi:MAG: hypothetical protein CME06_18165 [Gemmatimonadetes bacterium]|nr:hypothetical protein [Gemmatimonadota bacterium]